MKKRKLVFIEENLWHEFAVYAVKKFGSKGFITKAIEEAIKLWVEREKSSEQ